MPSRIALLFCWNWERGQGGRPSTRVGLDRDTYTEVRRPTRVKKSRSNVLVVSPRPKPSGSLRVIGLLRQSYITLHLYQTNWLAFYGQLLPRTAMDTLMDNRQTQSPYGRCRSRFGTYNPKSFSLSLFFQPPNAQQMTWRECHIHWIIQAQTREKKVANIILRIQPALNLHCGDCNCQWLIILISSPASRNHALAAARVRS